MGILIAIGLSAAVLIALGRQRPGRGAMQLYAAALMVGAAGYALVGQAGLAGSPASQRPRASLPPAMPIELASEFYGRFNAAYPWLVIANGFMGRGDSRGAAATLNSALRARPNDSELWLAYGNALVTHAGGATTPASELAYARANAAAPGHPGPRFFTGLARVREGRIEDALTLWRALSASAPPNVSWKPALDERIALLERMGRAKDQDVPRPVLP